MVQEPFYGGKSSPITGTLRRLIPCPYMIRIIRLGATAWNFKHRSRIVNSTLLVQNKVYGQAPCGATEVCGFDPQAENSPHMDPKYAK